MFLQKNDLVRITDYLWEIPQTYRGDMRVPARIYADEKMLELILRDRSLEQLVNVATLPQIQKAAYAMPDAHEGYGFPIGGVAATKWPDGVISPGGIGYDINCGVRLLKTNVAFEEIEDFLDRLAEQFYRSVPSGVGIGGKLKLSREKLDEVLRGGAEWAVKEGYGEEDDLRHIESFGKLANADPGAVSDHAKNRGRDQLGTLGAGNHFLEIDRVDQIFDEEHAKAFGLFNGQIVILIHTGSRGLGHQVATDHIRAMLKAMPRYGIEVPDRELVCVPLSSSEGTDYFNAMAAAANFAWANRQLITWGVRQVWRGLFGDSKGELSLLYDVAHNIAKVEEHEIDGEKMKLILHRKGATRAFGPGHPELAEEYRRSGQPIIIPGSMGTASYVLVGTEEGMKQSFGSTCHGAGRTMSRHSAVRQIHPGKLMEELKKEGISVKTRSMRGLSEEAPQAYKDIHDVVEVVSRAGIARKVARLKPLVVIKG